MTLGKVVATILGNGGKVSKSKRKFVLQYMSAELFGDIEQQAQQQIDTVKTRLNINVVDVMKRA